MPSLNIKDDETYKLVKELAEQTGESLTAAVKTSVKERLERQEKATRRESRMEWLERLTAYTSKAMDDGRTTKELFDELYDERTGLPK